MLVTFLKITYISSLFFSRAPTHHSFTFNLRFLYELKHKIRVSKTVCGMFHDFKRDFKRHNSLQN